MRTAFNSALFLGLEWLIRDGAYPRLSFVLLFASILMLWARRASVGGVWSPEAIYIAASALYVLSPLADAVLFGNQLELDVERMTLLAATGTGFLISAVVGMELGAPRGCELRERTIDYVPTARELQGVGVLALAASAGAVLLVVVSYGLGIGTVSRADLYLEENVLLTLIRNLAVVVLLIALALHSQTRDRYEPMVRRFRAAILLGAVLYCAVDILILGDRRLVLILILAALALLAPKRLSVMKGAAIALLAVSLLLVGVVRNKPVGEWIDLLADPAFLLRLSPAAQEFGSLAIVGGSIENLQEFPDDFPRYVDAFAQLLPQSVAGDRPQAPSEWFVWTYYPAIAAVGASFAFNGLVEAIGNGGLIAVVLVGLLTGILVALMARLRLLGSPVGLAAAIFVFAFAMRMEFASVLRNFIYFMIGIVLTVVWVRFFGSGKRRAIVIR